jgi:hypothetical protein
MSRQRVALFIDQSGSNRIWLFVDAVSAASAVPSTLTVSLSIMPVSQILLGDLTNLLESPRPRVRKTTERGKQLGASPSDLHAHGASI